MADVYIGYCIGKPEDNRHLLEWIDENCKTVESGQQKLKKEKEKYF